MELLRKQQKVFIQFAHNTNGGKFERGEGMEQLKSIRIKQNTYNELKELGEFGESFDDLIKRLIKKHKKQRKKDEKW